MVLDIIKKREEFTDPHHLLKTSDGQILFIREWKPPSPSNIAILIFHGITAYSGPYGEIVSQPLAKAGYNVFGLDLRGHGLSDGIRGDYPSKERLLKDLEETIFFVKEKIPTMILLGHSLGVVTAGIALNHYSKQIDGLILLSAARTMREGIYQKPSFAAKLKILFSSIFSPSKPVIKYYRDGITGLDDPLRNFTYTLRFMRILSAKDLVFPESVNIPVLVGVGDQDELFEVEAARALLDEINSKNKKFLILKGAKHAEMPEGVFDELIEWLDSNFKRG